MSEKINKKQLLGALIAALPTLAYGASGKFYGILDEGLVGGFDQHVPASDHDLRHNWGKGNGADFRTNFTSRFGYESYERISNDLEIEARLESTIDPNAKFSFDRHMYLGLNTPYGTLRIGRTRDLINGIASRMDPFVNDGLVQDKILIAQHASIGLYRIQRSFTYISPSVGGFQFSAQYGMRKSELDSSALKLLITYDTGTWGWHAGIDQPSREHYLDGSNAVVYHYGPNARNIVFGALRDFGVAKLSTEVLYSTRDMAGNGVDPALPQPNASPWGAIATLRVPVTAGELKFVLVESEQVFNKAGTWQPIREVGFGYEHFLSKDTILYLQLGHEQRSSAGHWHTGLWKRF